MVESGIKPAYVFDGKPPELKSGVVCVLTVRTHGRSLIVPLQLSKRLERREEAKEAGEEAKETGELSCVWSRWDVDPL